MITTSFARTQGIRVSMQFVNAIVILFLVSSSLWKFTIPHFTHSMDSKKQRIASLSRKMFTVAKKQKWTAVESILIDYHITKMNTFAAMVGSRHKMNANNLLSISNRSNVWPPEQLIPGFKNPFHLTTGPFTGRKFWISILFDHA